MGDEKNLHSSIGGSGGHEEGCEELHLEDWVA